MGLEERRGGGSVRIKRNIVRIVRTRPLKAKFRPLVSYKCIAHSTFYATIFIPIGSTLKLVKGAPAPVGGGKGVCGWGGLNGVVVYQGTLLSHGICH